ncbi:TrbI/VirB10 family protein [Desulfurobacterium sp.]
MSIEKKKQKQFMMMAGFLAAAIGVIIFLLATARKNNTKPMEKHNEFEFTETGKKDIKQWFLEATKQIEQVNQQLEGISKSIDEVSRKVREQDKKIQDLQKEIEKVKQMKTIPPYPGKPKKGKENLGMVRPAPPPPPPPPPTSAVAGAGQKKGKNGKKQQPLGLVKVSFESQLKEREKIKEETKYQALRKFYIPSGTFVDAVLLSGIDAPTGMSAKKDTVPVLLTLADDSILPNDWRYDLKDCRIIGEAYGDLSSERVYIKTDYMSCVDDEGNVYDFKFVGYVTGEDGKAGLRGRVVSKQGALIARAMLAGFFEGAANVLQTSATSTTVTSAGVVSTVNPDKVVRAGVFAGAAKAVEKLAEYYMNLLDQTFPVIEVGAGRKATLIVQKGRWIQRVGKTEEVELVKVKEQKKEGESK